jgi:DNA-binding PadR family transcriptional regulator
MTEVGSLVETIALELLQEGSVRVFDIVKVISKEDGVLVSQGRVHNLLASLKRMGYLKSENDGNGEIYSLTKTGIDYSEEILKKHR